MIKLKPILIKKWAVRGYQGRMAGYRCITECHECKKQELEEIVKLKNEQYQLKNKI